MKISEALTRRALALDWELGLLVQNNVEIDKKLSEMTTLEQAKRAELSKLTDELKEENRAL